MAGVRVVNKRKGGASAEPGELVIGVDRPSSSVLRNQHFMAHEGQRAEVITKFRADLVQDWCARGPMRAELERIAKLVRNGQSVALACWCAPKPCHGDVIKKAVEALLA